MSNECNYFVGVDVGSGSVRAALVSENGKILNVKTKNISIWTPKPNYYQQSSNEIWDSCCSVVKEVTNGVPKEHIKGIGFDATCSLAVVDKHGEPLSISPHGEKEQNIIMWMDHRAQEEADFINSLKHRLLNNVGGKISLEMEIPKLLWLKKHLDSQCWKLADKFFDLPDFLTWKATSSDSRSLCSVVCKWLYDASDDGTQCWNEEFMNEIGLGDLLMNSASKIGVAVKQPGEECGTGLTRTAASQMGLCPDTPVATSIIDAHAGGLGLVGCLAEGITQDITSRLSLICGTSTCQMAVSRTPRPVPGVWGPYWSAMVPGLWLNEAGQSATGALVDHILRSHPAGGEGGAATAVRLNSLLDNLACKGPVDVLSRHLHVWPDFHGNRSPLADPNLRGMICGLDLTSGEEQLAVLYLATIQALAYGTRHIVEELEEAGYDFSCLLICGGLSKNRLLVQSLANAVSRPVLVPQEAESVLLGTAMLAATASKIYPDVMAAIKNMACEATLIQPDLNLKTYHEQKYKVFRKMVKDQETYKMIMNEV